jgi:hypothetical protein
MGAGRSYRSLRRRPALKGTESNLPMEQPRQRNRLHKSQNSNSLSWEHEMFFRNPSECVELVASFGLDSARLAAIRTSPGPADSATFSFSPGDSYQVATQIVRHLSDQDSFLLWPVEYGIWPSLENLHLYYRVRMSYGDTRNLIDAPGHYFLPYENADLLTFLDLTIRLGWGAHLITSAPLPSCFLSHDGWLRVERKADLEPLVKGLDGSQLLRRLD